MADLDRRLQLARKALGTLEQLLLEQVTSVVRDALIQRFEYTFEATWQSAKHYLRECEGLDAASPAQSIRSCHDVGLLDEKTARGCLEMVTDRNQTVHTYKEDVASEIAERVKDHAVLLKFWLNSIDDRLQSIRRGKGISEKS
jgi:nucleotidyltransferase substrate binding protein (TIGR01987 family)